MKRNFAVIGLLLAFLLLQGCSKLFGGVRKDLDDRYTNEPTTGGVWPERQMLDASDLDSRSAYDQARTIGHSERYPANGDFRDDRNSWDYTAPKDRYRPSEQEIRDQTTAARERVAFDRGKFKNGARATKADFWDESQNEGSLWASNGQTNYFFTKNSVKGIGDIITINVQDQFVRDTAAEVKRNLSEDELDQEVERIQKQYDARALAGASGTEEKKESSSASAADPTRNPAATSAAQPTSADGTARKATPADVDLTKGIGLSSGETVMAEILERYPSGNYKIRGTKRLMYQGAPQMLTFVGIARANDINENDTMDSGKLYEYRLGIAR